jgi:hypothetical protein
MSSLLKSVRGLDFRVWVRVLFYVEVADELLAEIGLGSRG